MTAEQLARLEWFEETSRYMDTPSLTAEYLNLVMLYRPLKKETDERKTTVSDLVTE